MLLRALVLAAAITVPPYPTPRPATEHLVAAPAPERGSSQASPLFVKVIPEERQAAPEGGGDSGLVLPTWILAAATVALFFFTYKLWSVTGQLVRDGDKTAKRELRAYISSMPRKAALSPDNRTVLVVVETANTGTTPAFDTRVMWDVQVMRHPMKQVLKYQAHPDDAGLPIPTWVTYPGASHIGVKSLLLTDELMAQIRAKTHALYAYGRVTYTDAFGDKQWGEFCAFIDGDMFDIWRNDALLSEGRKPIPAPFKFTQSNNWASFS